MPSSLEDLCQQMGRAGRDKMPAYCKIFLDKPDVIHQIALARSDMVSKIQLESLEQRIMENRLEVPSNCEMNL